MPTPEHFTILITGTVSRVRSRHVVDNGRALAHLLTQLMLGEDIPDHAWHPWGITVEVGVDMDQGDG